MVEVLGIGFKLSGFKVWGLQNEGPDENMEIAILILIFVLLGIRTTTTGPSVPW